MARLLPYLLALLLGVASALLVACGGGTKGGFPAANASDLKSQVQDIEQAVQDGRCTDLPGQLRQVDSGIDALPGSVDERLRQSLRDASDALHELAVGECKPRTTQTTETTTTETTPPATTTVAPTTPETTTQPPETTTTPPPTTVTPPQPPPVTTQPPPPPPVVAPPVVPPPAEPPPVTPPGTPGGGASPGGGATPEVGPP